jgi:PAP2 superfamily/Bacterial Ig-like domain
MKRNLVARRWRLAKQAFLRSRILGIETLEARLALHGGPLCEIFANEAQAAAKISTSQVNQAPFFTNGGDQTVFEDSGKHCVKNWATGISAGSKEEQAKQSLTFVVTTDNPQLFLLPPRINKDGTLLYTPAPDANGIAVVSVRLKDNGGTANGGNDTSPLQSFTIMVKPVNDRPEFSIGKDQIVVEDSGPTGVTNWAKVIVPGPANESSQTVNFLVSTNHPSLFSAPPAISSNGTLSFTPAPNAHGKAKVTVRLKDDGGTANGGSDTSEAKTFTITVHAVNDAPSFVKGPDQFVPKGSGLQRVRAWATSISAGAPNESRQKLSFVVSTDNRSLFALQPAILANGTLSYKPARGATGTAIVTVRLKDNGGKSHGGQNTSPPQTFTINIGVRSNVAPSFTKGPDQVGLEDSGPASIPGWASAISPGPAHESNQMVSFLVSNDNTSLFITQPAIAANGTLTYTLTPNAYGSATVAVALKDDGGIANGGIDTSALQTFTITALPVNDAPSFLKGAHQQVQSSDVAVSVPGWATGVTAGASNELEQDLQFLVQPGDTSLFTVQPTIAADGTLSFTTAVGPGGTTNISVQLMDSGGVANGGTDTSGLQQFSISISPAAPGPFIVAALMNDTAPAGQTNFDGITFDPRIAGDVIDPLGVVSLTGAIDQGASNSIVIGADGSFVFDPPLPRDGSADGNHIAHIEARNSMGIVSKFEVSFTLDTALPLAPSLMLSAASGVVSSQTSNASRVTLLGTTDPGLEVTLVQTAANALANNTGIFQFNSVPLNLGNNNFTAIATDVAGNTAQTLVTIQRVDTAGAIDPVLLWNQTVRQAIRTDASNPTSASRDMAMVQAAIFDVVNAIENRTGYYVTLAAPAGVSIEASIAGAAHQVLSYLFPAQHALFDAVLSTSLAQVPDGSGETNSVNFGRQVGQAIIELRANDGWDEFEEHRPGTDSGDWQPSEPMYAVALDPQWATMQPWTMSSPDQFLPPGPPSLGSLRWANAYNEVKSLGARNSAARTADQLQIARFWAGGPGTSTPPGHWNLIAEQVATAAGNSIAENARLFAMLNIALADAAIVAWNSKFADDFWRPITAIHSGLTDDNELTDADSTWQPLLITPPFPEYISGHSTFSGAAATVMTALFGSDFAFSVTSEGLAGVTRSFTSFDEAAAEAGRSRVYGGIHYEFSNADGQAAGKALANYVLKTFDTASDTIAPRVFFDTDADPTTATNVSILGRVLDNLSGVVSLTAVVDGGSVVPVSFNSQGQFAFNTSLPLDGSTDGIHTVSLVAVDASGNSSTPSNFKFTLDTAAPFLNVESPAAGASLVAGDVLSGTVDTSGSSIVALSYAFNGQPTMPIAFNAQSGQFSTPLDLSRLAPGATTLTISARDAAGNATTSTINLTLAERVTFDIARYTPLNGARDVGSTYRPQVFFSRAVNPTSLSANNFYATGPNGSKLAANIVPAGDGSFAWLFFTQPMPGASQITVHLDGATILAAGDGVALDADGNGVAGGQFSYKVSTVSLTPLVGTSLSGKVVEAGPDLKPMTFDDIRVGPDQVLHTPDDVFLTPLAGVKVFIVGLESQFVLTDAQGNFRFDSAPAGNVKLSIDGRTATNAPAGTFFPEMVMDLNLEAGRANTVMGTMGTREQQIANRDRTEVYLPRLQTSILQNVSSTAPTTITVKPEAAANITPEQRAKLTLQVQPGSMRDQNGNVVSAGQVGISTVPPELVREMLPPGLLQHTFDITVQAPGVTNFATPAPMTFPNTFGAKPGEQLSFLSFDHTTGRLVIEGSATVSSDGLSVSTNPDTGITHPGWHGLTPQGSPTRPDNDGEVATNGTEFLYSVSTELLSNRPAEPSPVAGVPVVGGFQTAAVVTKGLRDYLLTDNSERVRFTVENNTPKAKSDGSYLTVKFIIDPEIAHKYLDGLTTTSFRLAPGARANFDFTFKPNLVDILKFKNDVIFGAKFLLEIAKVSNVVTVLPESGKYYLYRYVDAVDDATFDRRLKFPDAINDGAGGTLRTRTVEYRGDMSMIPTLSTKAISPTDQAGLADFDATQFALVDGKQLATLTFDPKRYEDNSDVYLQLQTPGLAPRVVQGVLGNSNYELRLVGTGAAPRDIYLNKAGLETQLARIANNRRPQDITLEYTIPKGKTIDELTTRFVLTYNNRPTAPLPLNISGTALALHLDPVVRGSILSVVSSQEETPIKTGADKGGTKVVRNYRIEFSDSLPNTSTKFVVLPPIGGTFKSTVKFDFNDDDAEISPNELGLINTPEERTALATNVLDRVRQHFAGFAGAVTFHDEDKPGAAYSIDWTTTSEDDRFGRTPTVRTETLPLLAELLKRRRTLNPAQFDFALAEILGRTQSGGVEVYVENFFALNYPVYDVDFDFVTRAMAKTTAHELGHNLGLMHNAEKKKDIQTDEVQVIDVRSLGPDDFFSLNFAGESTAEPIRPGATGVEVRDALRALVAFKNKNAVDVVAGPAGFYTVKFVLPKTLSNPNPDFHGKDLPELKVFGPSGAPLGPGSVITAVNGDTTLKTKLEIITTNSSGVQESTLFDNMASGPVRGDTSFQERTSGAGLKLASRAMWTSADTKAFVSQMLKIIKYTKDGFFDAIVPDEGEESADRDHFEFEGSFLELFTAEPNQDIEFVGAQIDFGSGSVVSPVVKRFSVANLGSEKSTIRSIGIVKGFGAFSTPQIPVTVLEPGDSLEFDVTFAPDAVLDYEGRLLIDSDLQEFNGEFDLIGNGQPPNKPAISINSYYNNLGGVLVGELAGYAGVSFLPNLTNNGTAPLTITEIRVAAGQGFGEYNVNHLPAPVILAPGESYGVGVSFRPSKVGLRPGTIEVISNDPRTPLLRLPYVATGVILTTSTTNIDNYAGVDVGNDYVVVGDMLSYQNNLPDLRTKSDDAGNWEFFLPANTGVQIATYDPVSGLIAHFAGFTNASGIATKINRANFTPSFFPDTDGDGLPDDVEFTIGTNLNQVDTDGDGTNDFAELDAGLNPSDDRPTANGIVSALKTGSTALDIKLAADFRDASRSVAYIASGNSGLTVADVTDFARPISLAQLGLPGEVNNLSLDVVRKLVAAASPTNGVHLINVANPAEPELLRTLPHEGTDSVTGVELYDGLIYIGVGGKIRAFDVQSGELTSDFALGTQRVLGISRSGDRLYATVQDTGTSQVLLRIFDISSAGLTARGSVVLPGITSAGDPYFANDIERLKDVIINTVPETLRFRSDVVWIPAGDRVVTVDVANPLTPEIITSTATIAQGGAADIELNGSGLAVVAGFVNPGGSAIVLQTPFANNTNQIFTRYSLPSFGQAVALSSGLAYIADGASGLQLVNFLQRDTGLTPPTILLNPPLGDINPAQPGLQLYEGTSITIGNRITDDVQVRKVELLVDGTVVRTELSYPYDLSTVLPTRAQSGNQAVLQVRATDSGGNSTLSDPIVIDLTADTTAPTISALDPTNGSTQPISRRKVAIKFSEALDRATIVPASFVLQGPSGPITPISIDLRQRDTQVEILYPPLAQGSYTFVTHAAAVKDRAGNSLGAADISSTFTVAAAVFVPTIRWVNDAGGDWANANNWRDVASNAPRVPTATDDVLIDVPTDALVTFSSDIVTVHSLVSNERFQILGGITTLKPVSPRLNVTTTTQVNNTFVLSGTTSYAPATFSGTILRGTGGQGLTISGYTRLAAATIQTDVTVNNGTNQFNSRVWIAGGLVVEGTFTVAASGIAIFVEGSQTWSSGMFVSTGPTVAAALVTIGSVGESTLTLGENVTFEAQVQFTTGNGPAPAPGSTPIPHKLSLINRGTLKAKTSTQALRYGVFTRTESFTNYGVMSGGDYSTVSLADKVWTNAATGRIKLSQGQIGDIGGMVLGSLGTTTRWTNAGTIELINARAFFYELNSTPVGQTWSNTGTIIVDKSFAYINGLYTSGDVTNFTNTGIVQAGGVMDNTGRTFTYSNTVGVFSLVGRILGGTIVKSGAAELFLNGTLVGVALDGDFNSSLFYTDPILGIQSFRSMGVTVEQGLTLRGTISFYRSLSSMRFVGGPQTVTGGTIQFLAGTTDSGTAALQATGGAGPVTLDSTVTIRSTQNAGGDFGPYIVGNFISYATILMEANSALRLTGIPSDTNPVVFINRGTITVPASRTLNLELPFKNEGQIIASGGRVTTLVGSNSLPYTFNNTGTINLAGGGVLQLQGNDQRTATYRTADLGTIMGTGGIVAIGNKAMIDNSGATLVIYSTSDWRLGGESVIAGGTIQIDSTAKFVVRNGILKDVTVNGNSSDNFNDLVLVGDLDFNGNIAGNLQFGHNSLYAGVPLILRGGNFDLGYRIITGASGAPSVTLEADVVFKGYGANATFTQPLTNRGQIVASPFTGVFFDRDRLFHFTAAPITNEGTLSAINGGILRINNLAAPNSGIVSAAVDSKVEFTGAFAQIAAGTTSVDIGGTAATQFGSVNVTGAATLAGKLDVQFASGYTPTVGSRYQVLNYASASGVFSTLNVTGLASGLIVTPEYNATNMTLVVSSAGAGEGGISSFTTVVQTIGSELEDSFALTLAPTISAYVSHPVKVLRLGGNLNGSSGVTLESLNTPPTKRGSSEDISTEIDEVFVNTGHELLSDDVHVSAASFTNEGTLSAVNREILWSSDMPAPNSGIVSSAARNSVEFTGAFALAAKQFDPVAFTSAAASPATLDVQLAHDLTVTPQYNGLDLNLFVVGAGGVGEFSLYATVNQAIGVALEQLFPLHSKRLALSPSTISDNPRDPIKKLIPAGNLNDSRGVAQYWSSAHQPPTKRASSEDTFTAIDEVFAEFL